MDHNIHLSLSDFLTFLIFQSVLILEESPQPNTSDGMENMADVHISLYTLCHTIKPLHCTLVKKRNSSLVYLQHSHPGGIRIREQSLFMGGGPVEIGGGLIFQCQHLEGGQKFIAQKFEGSKNIQHFCALKFCPPLNACTGIPPSICLH